MNEPVLKIESCDKCPFIKRIRTPDPTDWFNDDDEKAVCTKKTEKGEPKELGAMLRPYEKVGAPPKWCPLRKKS
jgi:hypothetical protein